MYRNESSKALFPSLHHRKEGRLHRQENVAKPPKPMQTGGFPCPAIGKPPRPRGQRRLRDILFDRSATPPCGDARRGMAILQFVHNSMTADDLANCNRVGVDRAPL